MKPYLMDENKRPKFFRGVPISYQKGLNPLTLVFDREKCTRILAPGTSDTILHIVRDGNAEEALLWKYTYCSTTHRDKSAWECLLVTPANQNIFRLPIAQRMFNSLEDHGFDVSLLPLRETPHYIHKIKELLSDEGLFIGSAWLFPVSLWLSEPPLTNKTLDLACWYKILRLNQLAAQQAEVTSVHYGTDLTWREKPLFIRPLLLTLRGRWKMYLNDISLEHWIKFQNDDDSFRAPDRNGIYIVDGEVSSPLFGHQVLNEPHLLIPEMRFNFSDAQAALPNDHQAY